MAVIVEVALSPEEFVVGRVTTSGPDASIRLETIVSLGERSISFVRFRGDAHAAFEESVRSHAPVQDLLIVETHADEALYAIELRLTGDRFLDGLLATEGELLAATGDGSAWLLQLRLPSHDALSEFESYCREEGLAVEFRQLYNPTGAWYGLTEPQRETLTYAVEAGYYSIPREISTKSLAAEFDISDQAVTERLRRAIVALVSDTLSLDER